MGEVRELNPGDWLYPHVQVRSYMLVEAGLTGRIVATADGQSGAGAITCVCEKFRIVKRSLF